MKDYYIGLDVGTDSVGWAVTDKDYNLLKFKDSGIITSEQYDIEKNNLTDGYILKAFALLGYDKKSEQISAADKGISDKISVAISSTEPT